MASESNGVPRRRGRDTKLRVETDSVVANEQLRKRESSMSSEESGREATDGRAPQKWKLPSFLDWIPANWTWTKIKPVIRCAIVMWVSALLFIIPSVQHVLGQASFLILIAAFFSPPSDPFFAVLEREMLILISSGATWAWCCLGMKFADMARTFHNPNVSLAEAATGKYIEAAPSIILAVFLGVWTTVLLYVKARQGPGPWTFASVFGCICLDISLTTAALFPFPYYLIGKTVFLPLCFHSAVSLLGSIIIFPSTISAQFTTRLQGVLAPLITSLSLHQSILKSCPSTPEFSETTSKIITTVALAEALLLPLAAAARLLGSDLIYARYAPDDFRVFQDLARRVASRGNGMGMYFSLIDPTRDKFPITPAPSVPHTPRMERSRGPSLERTESAPTPSRTDSPARSSVQGRLWFHFGHHHRDHHEHGHQHGHHSLLHHTLLASRLSRFENVVGVFESQKYLNLEATRFRDPLAVDYTTQTTVLLNESCQDLLEGCQKGLSTFQDWLETLRHGRMRYLFNTAKVKAQWESKLADHEKVRDELAVALEHFRQVQRHRVLDPYRPAFEPQQDPHADQEIPPHRYLFHCYVYQYHLIQFAWILIEMLDEMIRLEKERQTLRLWTPVGRLIRWNDWEITENVEQDGDVDPDCIQGVAPAVMDDLGTPRKRDPDALPPRNRLESAMNLVYHAAACLTRGNVVFAIKAAVMTVILALPSFLKSSAEISYKNRYSWAVIMGQVTLSRFRGDTVFSFFTRILSTFMGGVVGMVMWYVSCGSGRGNPYGLAAVFAVCCFPFFYARLYLPWTPLTTIVFFVTALLVVGYSYQDVVFETPGSPGYGFTVAWRRFVLVAIGVAAAFIVSFLPPSTTIRRYQRASLATTCSELGAIYCAILSFAYSGSQEDVAEINAGMLAIRNKIRRSIVLRTNVVYEFSLRGRWPVERYNNLSEIQLQIAYGLSHLMSVIKHLEPAWARAMLRRTRFLDTDFQGDTLAVITMVSSSLRSGAPLPQITPCPLLDRFMLQYHGLDVIHKEAEEDYGLPRTLTLETLQDEQYLFFCVGVSTAFSIITRLDRLMVAAKEIVGEQYHIHGVGLGPTLTRGTEFDRGRPAVHFGPSQEV